MSYITSYPSSLKQLDLSHNKICVWPSLPQINLEEAAPDQENILCYRLETGLVPKSTIPSKLRTSVYKFHLCSIHFCNIIKCCLTFLIYR